MRRIRRLLLVGLTSWQVIVLLVAVRGVAFPPADMQPVVTAGQREELRSLLQPSAADLERTVQDVDRARRDNFRIPRASWEESLSAALVTGDVARAQTVWQQNCDVVLSEGSRGEVTAALEALQRQPGAIGRALHLAEVLSSVSSNFDGLGTYLWTLWDQAATARDRAEIAALLAGYVSHPAKATMLRAALQYRLAAGDAPPQEIAEAALSFGIELAGQEQDLLALWLFDETVRRTEPGTTWGPAMYNAALMRLRLGQHRAARETAVRLIESRVNEQDPGPDLMNISQSYRHRAARLVAHSYGEQGAYPLAYYWSLRSAEEYPFRSWCGTCNRSAAGEAERELAADAARMGPLGLAGHMLYRPNLTLLLWIPFGLVAGTVGSLTWWRHRRLRRRIARQNRIVAGTQPEKSAE